MIALDYRVFFVEEYPVYQTEYKRLSLEVAYIMEHGE
jgi:hypothetical protein